MSLPFIIPPVVFLVSLLLLVLLLRRSLRRISHPWQIDTHDKKVCHTDMRQSADMLLSVEKNSNSSRMIKKATQLFSGIKNSGDPMMDVSIAEREKVLIKRIATNPSDKEAYELLGQVYLVQGNFVDAKECYQQVLIFEPQHPTAIRKLERIKRLIDEQKEMG